jgi:hypothetical protein
MTRSYGICERLMMVAALFVQTNGVYFGLPNVDPWDIQRDAPGGDYWAMLAAAPKIPSQ